MPNNIATIRSYATILDRVYQREATSSCLNSPARMARPGRNAKEIMAPKSSTTGLGDYKRKARAFGRANSQQRWISRSLRHDLKEIQQLRASRAAGDAA